MGADFNGDGRDDILWRFVDGTLGKWVGNPDGGFTPQAVGQPGSVSNDWQVVATADFNGDGSDDVLWRHANGTLTNWLSNGSGGFTDNGAVAANFVSTDWQVIGAGDFNGDGRDDLLWRHVSGGLTNWLGAANGGFVDNGAAAANIVSSYWHVTGIGDFNGDGRDDILWRHTDGLLTSWLGTPGGGFADNGSAAANFLWSDWFVAGVGDFNGDGRDDILWRSEWGPLTSWLGTASGGFVDNGDAADNYVSNYWDVLGIGDFNGDGRDDILWRHLGGAVIDWLGTPTGGFVDNGGAAYPFASRDWSIMPGFVGSYGAWDY